MSPIREATIRLIEEMPEENIIHIFQIIKGVNGLYKDPACLEKRRRGAFHHIQQFRGKIPESLDYNDELTKSRTERYADTN